MASSVDDAQGRDQDQAGSPGMAVNALIGRQRLSRDWKSSVGWIVTILIVVVVFSSFNHRFASLENLRNILEQASVLLIILVGTSFVIRMGSIDLSVQGVMGASGMTWILLVPNARDGVDLGALAWVIAMVIGLLLGLLTGAIYATVRVPSLVVTLGTWNVGLGVATILYGDNLLPSLTSDAMSKWPTRMSLGLPNAFWLAAIVVGAGSLLIGFSHLGRGMLAIGNNEALASVNGVPVTRIKIAGFGLAGLLNGLAGILATMELGSGSPGVGAGQLFTVIPAAVIGGTALSGGEGGIQRSALGVLLLVVLNNGLVLAGVNPDYLRLTDVTCTYGPVVAIKSVSLDIRRGEVVGLVGENGAGKSSLLKILAGNVVPDKGRLEINGTVCDFRGPKDAFRAGVGVVHQEQSLFTNLTIAENIDQHRSADGAMSRLGLLRWSRINRDAAAALEKIGVKLNPRTLVRDLSFIDRQMVEIARAVCIDPTVGGTPLIVLDEPTAVLERKETAVLRIKCALRVGASQKLVQKDSRNGRLSASGHVRDPPLLSCPATHEIPDTPESGGTRWHDDVV